MRKTGAYTEREIHKTDAMQQRVLQRTTRFARHAFVRCFDLPLKVELWSITATAVRT